ncbi:DEAD/DEAH box helicase [Natranaerobius trueperi]|uniref:DNA/RNA helicase n=1 Tax=Natranaerobius trueperi TaxID=759412 RepID=A0A226C380_9FIRM|nr:DEAD/DEAH box helicase [Natranaerobius trueperi]OWZ84860.1 DNA/RNA helicase [Natranaerobius trueperi]
MTNLFRFNDNFLLRKEGKTISKVWENYQPELVFWNQKKVTNDLEKQVSGRALLFSEIASFYPKNDVIKKIIELKPIIVPGVVSIKHKHLKTMLSLVFRDIFTLKSEGICLRCGSTNVKEIECVRCSSYCLSCRDCFMTGESTSCTPLFLFSSKGENKNRKALLSLEFSLTKAQQRAYDMAVNFVKEKHYDKALVYAVCGAGKTETVFGAIKHVLDKGGKVLYATPRRDLVKELSERFQKAFIDTDMLTLYGGSESKYSRADLVMATTHQVMRYYSFFDLVVLDEVDAFPYKGSKRLPKLVYRAGKKDSQMIYITATPDKEFIKSKLELITVPSRFHKYPAPEPELVKGSFRLLDKENFLDKLINYLGFSELPKELTRFFIHYGGKKPIFVFVPAISLIEPVTNTLRHLYPNLVIESISSKDQKRDKKRDYFLKKKIDILVTTTIMERGVTVSGVQVVVLFCHHKIFESRTLIQIAGRVGRKKEEPQGEVLFIGEKITPSMKEAKKTIINMNREAKRLGFLDY